MPYFENFNILLGGNCLSTAEDLAAWLSTTQDFPLFAKPAHGGFGRGTYLIEGHDAETGSLRLSGVGLVSLKDFVATLGNPAGLGYLFQEVLKPHPALATLTCERLSTVRVLTLAESNQQVSIYRSIWKVPRQANIIDNFESGTTGNLLGQVEIASGRVVRVIQGYGLELLALDRHPDSGLQFCNLTLPDWQELKALAVTCAQLMPEFKFQHWDMAITDRGPIPLEVNLFTSGGTELSQLVEQRGLLEDRLLAVCRAS